MEPEIPRELAEQAEEEARKKAQGRPITDDDDVGDAVASGSGWCDACDIGDCDTPDCDCGGPDCLLFLRLSMLLALMALLVPERAGGAVLALLRFYRRRLTRFTPVCPSTPSCSAYAVSAVQTLGPRRGLRAAGRRIRACSRRTVS